MDMGMDGNNAHRRTRITCCLIFIHLSTSFTSWSWVYFIPGLAPFVGLFSSHPSTPSSNAGTHLHCMWAHCMWTHLHCMWTHLHCMWAPLSTRTHLHSLLILMAVTSLKCICFFVCVCISIDSVFFVECFFEMLFFYFELYSQCSSKLLSVFKELFVFLTKINNN